MVSKGPWDDLSDNSFKEEGFCWGQMEMEDQEWGLEALHPNSKAKDWNTESSLRL